MTRATRPAGQARPGAADDSGMRGASAWKTFVGFGLVVIVAYRLAPIAGVSELPRNLLYWALDVTAVVVLLAGVRLHRPAAPWPWRLLALGQACALVADLTFYGASLVGVVLPYPSVADVLYLAQYPVTGVALFLLIRRRTPGRDVAAALDACIVGVAAGLLAWVYLITPAISSGDLSLPAILATVAYPVGDLITLAVGARLVLGTGYRPPAFRLLIGSLALVVIPDALYTWQVIEGTYTEGGWLETLWMGSWILLGAAALHPSMRQLSERAAARSTGGRLVRLLVLAAASLLAPATLFTQYVRGADLHVPVVAGVCALLFLLVLARMAGLVAAQHRVAITDDLTGLRTRRFFEHALAGAAARNSGVSVLLLDVDRFKHVNDSHGHHGGDLVLREVARRLGEAVRPGDVVARYGGEEFAVLLPDVTDREAVQVAERVHRAIRETPIAVSDTVDLTVTVSVGAATPSAEVDDPAALVLLADRLLYQAKETGRDRVATA